MGVRLPSGAHFSMIAELRKELKLLADKNKAEIFQRFFKTGKGEYGEGDIFLGINVPNSRKIAIKYKSLPFSDIVRLLKSKVHEERLIALLILVHNFNTADEKEQEKIFNFYIRNTRYINNWDLVDLSADKIAGGYLIDKPRDTLYRLVKSSNLWERRIAIIATYNFIKNGQYDDALIIAKILIGDRNDLIQKAVGWMLREVGNRSHKTEVEFLNKNYKDMGRTALRYAIEKFPEKIRLKYLHGEI